MGECFFWYRLTRVVPDKIQRAVKRLCVYVCVCHVLNVKKFSLPRCYVYMIVRWSKYGFNNRTYCEKVRRTIEPYNERRFYLDLFDFAVIDALMYHFDSKHYSLEDGSSTQQLVVRLDHGRAYDSPRSPPSMCAASAAIRPSVSVSVCPMARWLSG